MEALLVVCLIVVLWVRWFYIRERFEELERRIRSLEGVPVRVAPPPAAPVAAVAPRPAAPVWAVAPPPAAPVWAGGPGVDMSVDAAGTSACATEDRDKRQERQERQEEEERGKRGEGKGRTVRDWEALVGGNFLNKLGIFILVIGIALALGYSFTRVGPGGRVAISLATSIAMLISGAVLEPRDPYRTFARGLLGGGWSALYFTVYAMYAIPQAQVIGNPVLAAVLLVAVAAGMIVHSLRYRSETVTGLAYFIAFVTLTPAISPVTTLSVLALIPLAGSLLYVAHHFRWRTFAVLGLIATYATCATHPDSGAPLWQAQALFTIYWLMFEAFDLLCADPWLLPLNAFGFLGLSLVKWHGAAPEQIWQFVAAAAAAYLVGAVLRGRSDRWRPAVTLSAALAAAVMFLQLEDQWVAMGLSIEAELLYLAGLRLRAPYLRLLAGSVFALELGDLAVQTGKLEPAEWTPVAALNAAVFYGNRALRAADTFYGYAGAAMLALIAGFRAPHHDRGLAWMALAVAPYAIGWRARLADFRVQAYGLGGLGLFGMAAFWPEPNWSIGIGAALVYAGAISAATSAADRFAEDEAGMLRFTGSFAAASLLAALLWQVLPAQYHGLGWMALAVALLELGMRGIPLDLRRISYAVAAAGAALVFYQNVLPIHNDGPLAVRLIPAGAAVCAYAMAARARREEAEMVLDFASFTGTGFLLPALWALLPPAAVAPAWAAVAIGLVELGLPALALEGHLVSIAACARLFFANFETEQRLVTVTPVLLAQYYLWSRSKRRFYLYTGAILGAVLMRFEMGRIFTATGWAAFAVVLLVAGKRWNLEDLRRQSYALAGLAFVRCWTTNFYSPEMFAGIAGPVLTGGIVIGSCYTAQLLNANGSRPRLYFSLLATALLGALLYYQVSGSVLTMAWGVEGVALLTAGFPLRDRFLRYPGLALLLFCILKLFVYDLRNLETLPRICSFLVLGLILVSASWLYTRVREYL